MNPESELLIVERVVPEDGTASLSLEWDVQLMLVVGGRLRTESDYRSLLHNTGFGLNRVIPLPLDVHILVAAPLVDST
jgi:hypothetical protein